MARTRRNYLEGVARDGKIDWKTVIARDNRATGLRDQKRDRRKTRVELKEAGDDESNVVGGKRRRYSDRYGTYEL